MKVQLKFAKPQRRKTEKARKDRAEAALIEQVRAACVERDGYCRVGPEANYVGIGSCAGPSEWAHLEDKRRFKTRGMEPAQRHSTKWTMMLCKKHHAAYDAHKFSIAFLTAEGANWMIRIALEEQHGEEAGTQVDRSRRNGDVDNEEQGERRRRAGIQGQR